MRNLFRRRAPELVIGAMAVLLALALLLSSLWNTGSYLSAADRSESLARSSGDIVVGCEFYDRGHPQYFRSGLRLALHEINEGLAGNRSKGIALPNGVIRPLRIEFKQALPETRLLQTDPTALLFAQNTHLAAVIDDLPDEWVGRSKTVYEAAGILNISTEASSPGLDDGLRFGLTSAVQDDELAVEVASLAPSMIRKTLGKAPARAALLAKIEANAASWTASVCQTEAGRLMTQAHLRAVLASAVKNGQIAPSTPLRALRRRFGVPGEFWNNVADAVAQSQQRLGSNVTVAQVLQYHADETPPVPFSIVQEYYPEDEDLFEELSAVRAANADYIVLVDNTTQHVVKIVKEMRRLNMNQPVIVSDNHGFDIIAHELGSTSGDVYTLIDQDPTLSAPRLREFRERYLAFLRAEGKEHEPGLMSLQGYEAVYLLKEVYETVGSIDPLAAANALRHRNARWPGRAIEGYRFSPDGNVEDVHWYPLWLHNGKLELIDLEERNSAP